MEIYITKYALTEGINKAYVSEENIEGDRVFIKSRWTCVSYGKTDWHKTKAEAKIRAEEMRQKKIASLKKQLAKMEKMTF